MPMHKLQYGVDASQVALIKRQRFIIAHISRSQFGSSERCRRPKVICHTPVAA
jgi:hypothetical protein